MKNPSKILMPSEYEPLADKLPGVLDRLSAYEDLVPYFPVIHCDEMAADGRLADAEYSDSRGFVITQDFAVGGGFFLDCPDVRYYSQAAGDEMHAALASAVENLRVGERLQFVWMINDEMDPLFQSFAEVHPNDPPLVRFIRRHRFARETTRFREGRLRQFTSAAFLQVPYDGKVLELPSAGGVGSAFSGVVEAFLGVLSMMRTTRRATLAHELLSQLPVWQDRLASLQRGFSSVRGLNLRPVHASDYVRFYQRILSPDLWERLRNDPLSAKRHVLDSHAPFAAQCVTGRLRDAGSYFVTGSYYHRVLTVEIPPSFVEMAYLMTALTRQEILTETKNLEVTLNITPRSRAKELTALRRRRDFILKQYRVDPDKKSELREPINQLNAQIEALENNERSTLFSTVLVAHLWDRDTRRLSAAETALISAVNRITTAMFGAEDCAALPYVLNYGLPGAPGKGDRHRVFAMTSEEVAPLIPLMGQGSGILAVRKDPLVPTLFETDLQTPYSIDFFARKRVSNYNGIAVGGSGTGKSFLFNGIAACYGNRRTRVIIIDAAEGAPAYKTMCKLLGGVYIDRQFRFNALGTHMGPNGEVANPDEEEMAGILATLEAILRSSETEALESTERSFLTEAVNYLFQNRPDGGTPYLRHLPDAMDRCAQSRPGSTYHQMAQDFGQILRSSWTTPGGDNVNARYVDGADDFEQSWLTVFDLKWVLKRRDLLTVFMTLIFRYINQVTTRNEQLPESERERIIVLTDEGWKALFDPAFAGLYLGLYKAGRSRYISAHLLTQDFSDFIVFLKRLLGAGEEVKTSPIITSSSHFFIAKVDQMEAERIGEVLSLPDSQWKEFAKLKREDGQYSEYAYLCRLSDSPNLTFTKIRYSPLPEELWAFTSQSDDDAVRLSEMARLREEIQTSGARDRMILQMGAAGWDVEALRVLSEEVLLMHVMVFRQAEKMKQG